MVDPLTTGEADAVVLGAGTPATTTGAAAVLPAGTFLVTSVQMELMAGQMAAAIVKAKKDEKAKALSTSPFVMTPSGLGSQKVLDYEVPGDVKQYNVNTLSLSIIYDGA